MGAVRNLAFAAGVLVAGAGQATATDLRLLSSWDSTYTVVPLIVDTFVEDVKKASDGDLTITMMGPEVVPPFEQLQPVSAGAFDLLFTHGGYHQGATGIGSALDATVGDPAKRRETGLWDYVDNYYQKNFNLKLIAVPTALTGFQLLLREPMKDGRLDGLTIRGTQVYHGLIKDLGGAPVTLPAGELYSAAERGVIDGIAWPAVGAVGMKLCEVTPYMIRPSYGVVSYMILMNLDSFKALTPEEQKVLLEQGKEIELKTVDNFEKVLAKEDAEMEACGGKMDEQSADWGKAAQKAFADQAWAIAIQKSGKEAEDFRAFAKGKGMTD